ncbi:MAG TPA: response regulator transcription factor [Drouetiella sp.]
MAKILLIEDDDELAGTVSKWLKLERHSVDVCNDGNDGLAFALNALYEILVVDVQLPGMEGFEIVRRVRESGSKVPVIMLTGKSAIDDKETGFESGADDYLTKPFSVRELVARIKALLRRPNSFDTDYTVGHLSISSSSHKILKNGAEINLLPIDHAVLEFMMRHPNEVFSADTLISRVWPTDKFPSTDAVRSSIKRIRSAIDLDGQDSLIETISKVGYRLNK